MFNEMVSASPACLCERSAAVHTALQRKVAVYRKKTGTQDHIHIALVTANGLVENAYSELMINRWVDASVLF